MSVQPRKIGDARVTATFKPRRQHELSRHYRAMMWKSQFPAFIILLCSQVYQPVRCFKIHLPLSRRNGRFARHQTANLTFLSETLAQAESRYASTYRDVEDNRLVRRWQARDDFLDEDALLWHMEQRGPWYAEAGIIQSKVLTTLQVCLHQGRRASPDVGIRLGHADSGSLHAHDYQ